jgi:hypothetical protein
MGRPLVSRAYRPMTRQQRRAFERLHAKLAAKLDRPPTRRELATFYASQTWQARLTRWARRTWRACVAFLDTPVGE